MEITDWDSAGVNWEKPQLANIYDVLETIRLAVIEKANAVAYTHYINNKITKLSDIYNNASNIQAVVYGVLTLYANHTYLNGQWQGTSTVIPNWTVQDALDYLEDEYSANELLKHGGNLQLWIKRMYNLINLMRWIRLGEGSMYYLRPYQSYNKGGIDRWKSRLEIWNGAISNYNSDEYEEYPTYPYLLRQIFQDNAYYVTAKGKYKLSSDIFTDDRFEINFDNPNIKATASIWTKTITSIPGEYRDIFSTGVGNNELAESAVFPEGNFKNTDLITGEFIPQEWQDYPVGNGDYLNDIRLWPTMLLFKFDGPNGFKFLK